MSLVTIRLCFLHPEEDHRWIRTLPLTLRTSPRLRFQIAEEMHDRGRGVASWRSHSTT